jgi:hypothetical protein
VPAGHRLARCLPAPTQAAVGGDLARSSAHSPRRRRRGAAGRRRLALGGRLRSQAGGARLAAPPGPAVGIEHGGHPRGAARPGHREQLAVGPLGYPDASLGGLLPGGSSLITPQPLQQRGSAGCGGVIGGADLGDEPGAQRVQLAEGRVDRVHRVVGAAAGVRVRLAVIARLSGAQ